MSRRAVAPVVGVALLVAVTVLAGAVVAGALADVRPPGTPPQARLSLVAHPDGQVRLIHEGGDALDVTDLRVRVRVDGEGLRHQPPVPFVGAPGFDGAPSGPFNPAADGRWTAGEAAGFRVAGTNAPPLSRGATVRVTVYSGDYRVAVVETTVARRLRPPPRPPARPPRRARRAPSRAW